MKNFRNSFMGIILGVSVMAIACQNNANVELKTEADKDDYAMGASIGRQIKENALNVITPENMDIYLAGLNDVLKDAEVKMTDEEINQALANVGAKAEAKKAEALMEDPVIKARLEAGSKYIADQAKREGVVTLPSGLLYEVLVEGTGDVIGPTAEVTAHYELTSIEGKVIQSSFGAQPFTTSFTDGRAQLIPGWIEAIPMMKKGSKWNLYCPQNLAYGPTDRGADIPPFTTLTFVIEIVDFTK